MCSVCFSNLIQYYKKQGGYYDGILKERFYKGDSQKISDFIAESGKIYDYVQFENLLRQGIAKYSGTSGGHGWS